jgi:hypothetical protein
MKASSNRSNSFFLTSSASESTTYTFTLFRLFLDQSGWLLVVFGTSKQLSVVELCKTEQTCTGSMVMWFASVPMNSLTPVLVLGRISMVTVNQSK